MSRKKVGIVLGIVLVVMQINRSSQCGCGLSKSISLSSSSSSLSSLSKSGAMVVRPVELPKIIPTKPKIVCKVIGGGLPPPLKPLPGGDLCSCKKTIVSPAVVPKPACGGCAAKAAAFSQSMQESAAAASHFKKSILLPPPVPSYLPPPTMMLPPAQPLLPTPPQMYLPQDYQQQNPAPIPADPVSMSLAYQMAQKASQASEDKLSFGFRTIPKEVTITKTVKRVIPEENLYGLNGQVVELKPITFVPAPKTLSEEAAEGLLLESFKEASAAKMAAQKQVTLGELGYGPALIQSPPVLTYQGSSAAIAAASNAAAAAAYSSSRVPKPCNDGFVPGQVFTKTVMKPEAYQIPVTPPPPCSEEETPCLSHPSLPSLSSHPASPYLSYASSSSSSCSSAKQASSSSYLLRKLGL